ncbi:Myc-type [Theobroma cacao]|uniref:Basic helix-loop-helix DNA-binding superfamily protein isoform 1 n=2 Tax=Theobroma cacao TaxID=3641 RepID=A0A061DFA4_THECC|nr:Basic helix-loop-helix DNA-binding superfamily protein isoform 1 [Theobroma cacao]WRX08423.1 Myc-type [Theobroma cacao]
MDHQWKSNDFSKSVAADLGPSNPEPRQRQEVEVKDPIAARKVQKADREKLRRDRLNEQFLELGNTLDPDRPKNDKATILMDTIQMLKDLTAEVSRLKDECSSLTEESRELTQEKNELREEKASLKADIDNLNVQYQQRLRVMFPWNGIDPSVVMPPPYSYPVHLPLPTGPIPIHPSLQPYPLYGNHNPGAIANPCSTFMPYSATTNTPIDQPSSQHASSSHTSIKRDSRSKSMDEQRGSNGDRCDGSNDVATELELKMPGSSTNQELSAGEKKGKQTQKERSMVNGSSSSRYSLSQGLQDSSSDSVDDVPNSNK